MRQVTRIQTFDGELFVSPRDAKNHLETLQDNIVREMAHKMNTLNKYTQRLSFLEESIPQMRQIIQIQDDMILIKEDEAQNDYE